MSETNMDIGKMNEPSVFEQVFNIEDTASTAGVNVDSFATLSLMMFDFSIAVSITKFNSNKKTKAIITKKIPKTEFMTPNNFDHFFNFLSSSQKNL